MNVPCFLPMSTANGGRSIEFTLNFYGSLQRKVCDQVAKFHEPFANVVSRSIREDIR